jgi:methanogenic corrinoid protein MtbC1
MPALVSTSTVPRYPIRVVARRVGIPEMTLRAWERRHGAVRPSRSESGQRLFSAADIERLVLLRSLTRDGAAISTLASLSTADLHRLAPDVVVDAPAAEPQHDAQEEAGTLERELSACTRAITALDFDRLHRLLMRLVLERGTLPFLDDIVSPLCGWVGDQWARGQISEAQEATSSDVVRRVLTFLLQTLRRERRQRHVVLAALAGERHEFGAMMAAVVAAFDGWSYHYLGADLPATAVASAVKRLDASLVGISIVAPRVAAQQTRELLALRKGVGRSVEIVVGGPAAPLVESALRQARATSLASLGDWRDHLRQIGRGNA